MKELSVLSLGAGVQSSVLALLIEDGIIIPRFDNFCAIFADTGWEPSDVYDHLDWLETQLHFPVYREFLGNLKEHIIRGRNFGNNKFLNIPSYGFNETGKKIMGRRECTTNYKIIPIEGKMRKLLGVQRLSNNCEVEQMIGISTDEVHRVKPNKNAPYIYNRYPLIEMRWSRQDCLDYFNEKYPNRSLAKSSCLGCPYHSDAEWARIKREMPDEFEETCQVDEIMRMHFPGEYLHQSRKPLREVDFDKGNAPDLMGEECEGMCGV